MTLNAELYHAEGRYMLSLAFLLYADPRYAECHSAECRSAVLNKNSWLTLATTTYLTMSKVTPVKHKSFQTENL